MLPIVFDRELTLAELGAVEQRAMHGQKTSVAFYGISCDITPPRTCMLCRRNRLRASRPLRR